MNIGILAFAVSVIFAVIALIGEPYNKPPEKESKSVRYPYPRELP